MGQRPGLVLGQRLQPVAPNPLAITNISILVVPNIPTTRMLILLILIILPATPFPLSSPAFHTAPIPARHSLIPAFHTAPIPAPFPLSPSIPHHLLFPHAIPLIPAFHTTPVPARHSPYPSIPHHSCSRTPFPLSQHSTPLLFPHAIPLIHPSIPHRSYSRAPFPLSPSIPHHLLFPHAIPLIPAFHTAPIPARHSPYPSQHSTPLLFPHARHRSQPGRGTCRSIRTSHA